MNEKDKVAGKQSLSAIGDTIYDKNPITEVFNEESIDENIENVHNLFRYTKDDVSSPIIELRRESSTPAYISSKVINGSNGNPVDVSTFKSFFEDNINDFVNEITVCSNTYIGNYSDLGLKAIRIGTKQNDGELTFSTTSIYSNITLELGRYFSYNTVTQEKIYDTETALFINGTGISLPADDTHIFIEVPAGQSIQIESSGGRTFLYSFNHATPTEPIFKKYKLADTEYVDDKVQTLDDKLSEEISETNEVLEEAKEDIEANASEIEAINNKIGDIQIFQAVSQLPTPRESMLNKFFRYNNVVYQCIQTGGGVKEYIFNVSGTTEIKDTNWEDFARQVGNGFDVDFSLSSITKVYRNNGNIKFGSSSSNGSLEINNATNEGITQVDFYVTAYSSSKKVQISIDSTNGGNLSLDLEPSTSDILSLIPEEPLGTDDYINIYSETPQGYDKRFLLTKMVVTFGEPVYEWKIVNESLINTSIDDNTFIEDIYAEYGDKLIFDTSNNALLKLEQESSTSYKVYYMDMYGKYNSNTYLNDDVYSDIITDRDAVEFTSNKVTVINNSSTNKQYPSAKAVYDLISNIKRDHYQIVDIVEYPTLNDFLASTGEEGYLYLYPVDTSESPTFNSGFYRYVWEDNAWLPLGTTKIDLTNYTQKNVNETITGVWTFQDGIELGNDGINFQSFFYIKRQGVSRYSFDNESFSPVGANQNLGNPYNYWKDIYLSGSILAYSNLAIDVAQYLDIKIGGTNCYYIADTIFAPSTNNANDLGTSTHRWKDIYLSGGLRDGNSSYKLTLPDTTSWTADKEVATTDQVVVKANESIISDQYDSTKTYAVGDIVIYNNTLYKCTTAVTTAEDFDSTKWTATKVSELVADETIMRTDNSQTITGRKIFAENNSIYFGSENDYTRIYKDGASIKFESRLQVGQIFPTINKTQDLGTNAVGTWYWRDLYLCRNIVGLDDNDNQITIPVKDLLNSVKIKEDFSSQISLDNESSLTILRKECFLIKEGSSVKLHIYISGKNESGSQVSGVRFASNSTFTISNSAIADAIKDMNGNAISSPTAGEIKTITQQWYNGGNATVQALRMRHNTTNAIYLYSAGYSANINNDDSFIISIDEVLAV